MKNVESKLVCHHQWLRRNDYAIKARCHFRNTCSLIATALLAMLHMICGAPACQAKSQTGYQLSIEHYLWGTEKILVTDKGIKLIMLKHSFSGLLKAPDWKMYFYSDRRKKYCEAGAKNRLSEQVADANQSFSRQSMLRGLPVTTYTFKVNRPFDGNVFDNYVPQLSDVHRSLKRYQKSLSVVQEEISCLRENSLPREARSSLRKQYGIAGLPLQYIITLSDGQKITKIKFTGWSKIDDVPLSTFVLPTGYQRVASLNAIINAGVSSQVEQFSRDWGAPPEGLDAK